MHLIKQSYVFTIITTSVVLFVLTDVTFNRWNSDRIPVVINIIGKVTSPSTNTLSNGAFVQVDHNQTAESLMPTTATDTETNSSLWTSVKPASRNLTSLLQGRQDSREINVNNEPASKGSFYLQLHHHDDSQTDNETLYLHEAALTVTAPPKNQSGHPTQQQRTLHSLDSGGKDNQTMTFPILGNHEKNLSVSTKSPKQIEAATVLDVAKANAGHWFGRTASNYVKSAGGYVLALSYKDQVTSALGRIANIQCWAGKMKMSVVEPFLSDSYFVGTPTHFPNSALRFQSLFDLVKYNADSRVHSYAPLIAWDVFLKLAPRNVILVEINYYDHIRNRNEGNFYELLPECTFTELDDYWQKWLASYNFTVHHRVCIDFDMQGPLTMNEFNSLLFVDLHAHDSTVIFREWRGMSKITEDYIKVIDASCPMDNSFHDIRPSNLVQQHARTYIKRYLNTKPGYTAVMVRWERVLSSKGGGLTCFGLIRQGLDAKYKEGLYATFLTMDMGTYGSSQMHWTTTKTLLFETGKLLRYVNGQSISLHQHEQRFSDICRTKNPAYISELQKTIATQAKCLLLIGFGRFQGHAMFLWRLQHPGNKCLKIIRSC